MCNKFLHLNVNRISRFTLVNEAFWYWNITLNLNSRCSCHSRHGWQLMNVGSKLSGDNSVFIIIYFISICISSFSWNVINIYSLVFKSKPKPKFQPKLHKVYFKNHFLAFQFSCFEVRLGKMVKHFALSFEPLDDWWKNKP